MRFCLIALRAYKINKKLKRYEDEKENSLRISNGLKPKHTLHNRHHYWSRCQQNICYYVKNICLTRTNSHILRFWEKLKNDGTYENYVGKSILGFLGGMLLTYVFFIVFIIQLQFSITVATLLCALFGIILTLGLAFSHIVRVVVFLILPQFFSKRGRQALVAYAFVLALAGPAKNTLKNTEIMSESLACGQEQLKVAVHEIIDAIKKPFMAIKDAFRKVMKFMKDIIKKIKSILLSIKRMVDSIIRVIKSVFQWLGSIVNICNKKVGTPFQRCQRVFDGAIADCQAKLGPLFIWLCSLAYVISIVCYIVKILDFICMFLEFINDNIVGVMKKRIKEFVKHVQNIFYVSVDFKHSYNFETKSNVSMKEVAVGMMKEIHERAKWFLEVFDVMSLAFSFIFLLLLFKVIQYRLKFLTSDKFDNHFITKQFIDIDLRRARNELETLLPLNKREKSQYIKTKSVHLVKTEKSMLAKSAMFLFASTFKLLIIIVADYCLYWVLDLIRIHGRLQTKVQAPNMAEVTVQGEGVLADLYRSVVKGLKPLGVEMEIDTITCLPEPIPPDYTRYVQIISTIFLCWILAMLEPYGLRLRYVVMCYYYPARTQQRAVWLYNHILRSRGSYIKFARRQLRRRFGKSKEGSIEKISIMDRLRALCPFLNIILGKSKKEMCVLCGKVFQVGNQEQLIRCSTPNCPGLYCLNCYADINDLCTICKKPVEYGDLSDESLEKDSSEEDYQSHKKKKDPDINYNARSRTSSELSYSYQDDDNNDPNMNKPPLETRPPFKDVEKQGEHHPTTTQIFNVFMDVDSECETLKEIYKHPKRMKKLLLKGQQLKNDFSATVKNLMKHKKEKARKSDSETIKLTGTGDFSSSTDINSYLETDSESSDYGTVSSIDIQNYTSSNGSTFQENYLQEQRPRSCIVMPRGVHTLRGPRSLPAIAHDNYEVSDTDLSCPTLTSLSSSETYQSVKWAEQKSYEKQNIEIGTYKHEYKTRFTTNARAKDQINNSKATKRDSTASDLTAKKYNVQSNTSEKISYTPNKENDAISTRVGEEKTTSSVAIEGFSNVVEYDKGSYICEKRRPIDYLQEKPPISSKKKHRPITKTKEESSSSENETAYNKKINKSNKRSAYIDYKQERRRTQKNILPNEDSLTSLLENESDHESDTWTEMSSGPIPFFEKMEYYKLKPESRNKTLQPSLKSHILDSLKKLMPWKSDGQNISSEIYNKIFKNKHVKGMKIESEKRKMSKGPRKTFKSDVFEVKSVSSREKNNSSQLQNTKPIPLLYSPKEAFADGHKTIKRREEEQDKEESEESEEEIYKIERKPLIRKTETDKKDKRKKSDSVLRVDKLSLQSAGISANTSTKLNINANSDVTIPSVSEVVGNSSDEPIQRINHDERSFGHKKLLHPKGSMNLQSNIKINRIESKEQLNDLPKLMPVPGQRPLYDFDALPYQGHQSYFDLVNELENELKRRSDKNKEQQGRIPPDVVQSGVSENNNRDGATILPSSSFDFRVRPNVTLLHPDIVPYHHQPVENKLFDTSTGTECPNFDQRKELDHQPVNCNLNYQEEASHMSPENECPGTDNFSYKGPDIIFPTSINRKKILWKHESENKVSMQENNCKNSKSKENSNTASKGFLNVHFSPQKYPLTSKSLLIKEVTEIKQLKKYEDPQQNAYFKTNTSGDKDKLTRYRNSLPNNNDQYYVTRKEEIIEEKTYSVPKINSQHISSGYSIHSTQLNRNSNEGLPQASRRRFNDYVSQSTLSQTQTPIQTCICKHQPVSKQSQTSCESILPTSSTNSTKGQIDLFKATPSKQHHTFTRFLHSPMTDVRYYHRIGTISEEDEDEDVEDEIN